MGPRCFRVGASSTGTRGGRRSFASYGSRLCPPTSSLLGAYGMPEKRVAAPVAPTPRERSNSPSTAPPGMPSRSGLGPPARARRSARPTAPSGAATPARPAGSPVGLLLPRRDEILQVVHGDLEDLVSARMGILSSFFAAPEP